MRALRGRQIPSWWPTVAEFAVSAGMSIFVLSPGLKLLIRANAESAVRLITWRPLSRMRLARMDREVLRLIKKNERLLQARELLIHEGFSVA